VKKTSTGRPRLPEYMTVRELEARGACSSDIERFTRVFRSGRAKVSRRNLRRVRNAMGDTALEWLLETYHVPGGRPAEQKAWHRYWEADYGPAEVGVIADAFGLP
jgi:hypothetical protein